VTIGTSIRTQNLFFWMIQNSCLDILLIAGGGNRPFGIVTAQYPSDNGSVTNKDGTALLLSSSLFPSPDTLANRRLISINVPETHALNGTSLHHLGFFTLYTHAVYVRLLGVKRHFGNRRLFDCRLPFQRWSIVVFVVVGGLWLLSNRTNFVSSRNYA